MPLPHPTTDAVVNAYRHLASQNPDPMLDPADGTASARQMAAFLLQTQFLYAYDVRAEQIVFVSPGVATLLGRPAAGLSLDWLYAQMHPDDAPLVVAATAVTATWLGTARHTALGHVFSVDYRLRHAAGHYVRVLRQNMVLQLDTTGLPVVVGSLFTELTHHKRTTDVHLHCTHPQLAARLQQLQHPAGTPALSPREQQVLDLVLQGFSSANIAQQLNLSPNTVSTHRRNIAAKAPMGNRLHFPGPVARAHSPNQAKARNK